MSSAAGFVGIDLGTSGVKAVAVDGGGRVLGHGRWGHPTRRPAPGHAEQDPDDWARAVDGAAAMLRSGWDGPVHAVGLSGMIPTLVTLDRAMEPVGPAITWEDARAQAEGVALRERHGPVAVYRATGQWLDGRYLLPMWRWIAAHQPDRARATRWVASAKDLVFHRLTGQLVTDPSTATGFGCFALARGDWDHALAAGMGASRGGPGASGPGLPAVRPSTASAPLAAAAAARLGLPPGLPVVLGGADSVVGALGLGAGSPGSVAHLAGTSTVVVGVAERPRFDPRHRWLVTPLAGLPGWGLEMDLLATGSAIAWLGTVLGPSRSPAEVLELAARGPGGATGPVFLPYLAPGEQGALWEPELQGVVGGLTLATGPEALARALVEGMLVETARCVGALPAPRGRPAGPIHTGGWGADHAWFRQQLADATGRTVVAPVVPAEGLVSALGAARLAAEARGVTISPAATGDLRTEPDPDARARWTAIADRHDRWRRRTRPGRAAAEPPGR